ncbi:MULTISPECIES: WXG100 family type VII secretion target [Streptomycetaceae]|uniref:WXG100 family type VII secretion target n=1 Tax=Streptomycetaceae TaxID=2062 RepID=UPI000213D9C3|nr:WXG100 family type VII secretion target [Streptantibioticus cattleyicolor]CCB73387.1 conserved protein of unknown function [Streptantibioticus cattleyicolor NRRL 8057 = DSM 46488]
MSTPPEQPPIQKSWNLFNPGGDPSVLRACAQAWREMARDLKGIVEAQDAEVARMRAAWTGEAADAFDSHWSHTRRQVEEVLPHFETVAGQLDSAAEAIAKANAAVHHVVEEVATTALIGIGLSVLTAGFSDAVAAGAAEAEVAEAAGEVARLGQLLIKVAEVMERVKDAMEGSRLLKFAFTFGKNLDANFIGNVGGQLTTGQKVTWGQDLQDAAVAGVAGTAGQSGLAAVGGKVADWSVDTGAHAADEAWGPGSKIVSVLSGEGWLGNATVGATTSAAGQGAATGLDVLTGQGGKQASDIPKDMATSFLTGGAAGLANESGERLYEPGEGRHRADAPTPTFHAGKEIGIDGALYAAGNAIESELEN